MEEHLQSTVKVSLSKVQDNSMVVLPKALFHYMSCGHKQCMCEHNFGTNFGTPYFCGLGSVMDYRFSCCTNLKLTGRCSCEGRKYPKGFFYFPLMCSVWGNNHRGKVMMKLLQHLRQSCCDKSNLTCWTRPLGSHCL